MAAMKKSVKTKRDLNKMALGSGATVTAASGQKFNTAKKKAAPKPATKPMPPKADPPAKAAKPPAPEPVRSDPGFGLLADKINDIGKANVMMLAELKKEISAIKLQAAEPPTEWVFDMVRDDKGYLVRIKASAEYMKRKLN